MATIARQVPLTRDPQAWRCYWQAYGQPWRIEPEIDKLRKTFLEQCRSTPVDIEAGIYPFAQLTEQELLTRADVEYLLATHEQGRGPVIWSEEQSRPEQMRDGPDFRGANLRGLDLSNLPLTRALFGLRWNEWRNATTEQREMGASHLEGTNLWGANLEGARFRGAHLEQAVLAHAYLAKAQLRYAHLDRADLHEILVEETDFKAATISDAQGYGPRVADIEWGDTKLTLLAWDRVTVLGDAIYAQAKAQANAPHDEQIEAYQRAVRAHEQLSNALQAKGVDASRFRYQGKVLQRKLLWKQGKRRAWLASLLLDLTTGYGYRLGRIMGAYCLNLGFWALLYSLLTPLNLLDAVLLASTGRGLADAPLQIWLANAGEGVVNFVLVLLISTMVLQRLLGK